MSNQTVGFNISAFSDLSYEGMTVLVEYAGEQIAQLNMDRGAANIEIVLFGPPFVDSAFKQQFSFAELMLALERARERLLDFADPTLMTGD